MDAELPGHSSMTLQQEDMRGRLHTLNLDMVRTAPQVDPADPAALTQVLCNMLHLVTPERCKADGQHMSP